MSCSTTSGNPCNNLASMVGYNNPREKMVALLHYDPANPSIWNNGFDGTIKKAITTQRVHMPLNLLNDQVEAGVQFKLRDSGNAKLCPDIDVSVELPCAPSGVEAAIFCENALSDHIIGFDIEKVMSGKYPMSLRCQGDKVEVSVFTPLGINFVLSKKLTAGEAVTPLDGWHFRLEGCKSLGNSHFIKNRCLMHCAADYKYHTLKLECDVGFKVFDQLTLWNTNDFCPTLNGSIKRWKTAVQVETQDLLSCNNLVDMLRSASSKSSEDTTTLDHEA